MDMEEKQRRNGMDAETEAYLARIRKTVKESRALVEQVELRRAETDRLLESQGLTREQLAAIRFTPEQIARVNEELRRRGLPPVEDVPMAETSPGDGEPLMEHMSEPNFDPGDIKEDLENRKRKFGVMMNNIRL